MAFQYNKVYTGDALAELRKFPDDIFQVCITSFPYWGKRAYGNVAVVSGGEDDCEHIWDDTFDLANTCVACLAYKGALGQESTIEQYVEHVVEICREIRRTLRSDGTFWINLGDVFAHKGVCGGGSAIAPRDYAETGIDPGMASDKEAQKAMKGTMSPGLKEKDLAGVPWEVALALRKDGWWLRADNIWNKTNKKPEPMGDRPTIVHEYVFLLTKSADCYYDAWASMEPSAQQKLTDAENRRLNKLGRFVGRQRRSVWTMATGHSHGGHVAVFNQEVPRIAITAGTSSKGACGVCAAPLKREVERLNTNAKGKRYMDARARTTGWTPGCLCYVEGNEVPCLVLDPFMGQGTTAAAAEELGRSWVGIDLDPDSPAHTEKMVSKFRSVF